MKLPTTTISLATLVAAAGIATAATIQINVGQDGLTFTPNTVTASVGDIVEYHFFPPTHSVVMGDFDSPCTPAKTGGFFSGGITTSGGGENPNVFQVQINSTTINSPIFFYCAFPGHCEAGMSGVINPTADQTLAMYQSKAAGVAKTVAPPAPFGGKIVAAAGSSDTSSSSSSSSSSSTTATSSTPASSTSAGAGGGAGAGAGGIYGGGGGGKSGNGATTLGVSVLGLLGAVVLLV